MKRLIFLMTALVLALLPSLALAQDSVPWAADLETAKLAAARQNRLVLLHFSSQNCRPCRALEANVFTQPYFGSVVGQYFVPVKIDIDQQPALAAQYDVRSWPCDVIITPQGQVVHHMTSPQDVQQYLTTLQQVAQNHSGAGVAGQPVGGLYEAQQPASSPVAGASWSTGGEATTSGYGGQWQPPTQGAPAQPQAGYGSQYQPAAQSGYGYGGQAQTPQAQTPQAQTPQAQTPQAQTPQAQTPQAQTPQAQGFQGYGVQPGGSQYDGSQYGAGTYGQPTQPAQPAGSQYGGETSQYGGGAAPYGSGASQYGAGAGAGAYGQGYGQPAQQPAQTQPPVQPQPQQQAASAPAGGNPPLGLEGFCPVTLNDSRTWVQGDPRWGVIHRGRTYLFVSAAHHQRFLADPDTFAPMISGNDPVEFVDNGQLVEGARSHGVFYGEQMYLFRSEQNLQAFWNNPQRYSRIVIEAMSRTTRQR